MTTYLGRNPWLVPPWVGRKKLQYDLDNKFLRLDKWLVPPWSILSPFKIRELQTTTYLERNPWLIPPWVEQRRRFQIDLSDRYLRISKWLVPPWSVFSPFRFLVLHEWLVPPWMNQTE